jgi:hypothetical protein
MSVGYKAEEITKKRKVFFVPVLTGQESLVLKSQEDFEKFVKQHEKNFNGDVEKRMGC